MPQTPNSELSTFLAALWPDLGGQWLLFWGAPSKRSAWVQSVEPDEIVALSLWSQKENVYVGCGLRGENLGPTLRGEKSAVVAIPGVWLDIDYGTDHKKPNLPKTEAEAMTLVDEMGPAPSAIIHSGRGLQAWWLFKEPWVFEDEADRARAEVLTMGWCSTLRARAHAHGWDADQVGDLTRVMRLPGLWNRKGAPKPTKLLRLTDDRYDPSELEPYLLQEAMKERNVPNLNWAFDLRADAEPPATKFLLLCEIDTTFRLSWEHARQDLADQSASSYDMSLATRAMAAGWTGQEIVNLLIAHRRKHGVDTKLRTDYYASTLNVAASGKSEEERKQAIEGLAAGKPLPESVRDDPAEVLAILSSQLGVSVTKLVRFRSEGNSYQIEINGRTINVTGIEDFDSQCRFRRMVLDHTDVRIPVFKADAWHTFLQQLFLAVENVDVVDGTNKGAFETWLDNFLSDGIAKEEEWQKAALQYRPFVLDGQTYLVGEGFRRYLVGTFQERLTTQQLTVQLTKLGHHYEKKNVGTGKGGRTQRGVWRLAR